MMQKDFYDVLGVTRDADPDVIVAAYRALAKKYHPDTGKPRGTGSPERFRQIQEAYETLSDASRRAAYDNMRRNRSDSQRSSQKAQQAEQPSPKGQRADQNSEKPSQKEPPRQQDPPKQPDPPSVERSKFRKFLSDIVVNIAALAKALALAFFIVLTTILVLGLFIAFSDWLYR